MLNNNTFVLSTSPDWICLDVHREKQRREDMRQAFKTLAESMYGEDRDNTKYCEILNHTEPKVQLLNKVSSNSQNTKDSCSKVQIFNYTEYKAWLLNREKFNSSATYHIKKIYMCSTKNI